MINLPSKPSKKKEKNAMIPQDPVILLSCINTQLRDNYSSLDKLADGLDLSENEIKEIVDKLEGVGYKYDAGTNQFK